MREAYWMRVVGSLGPRASWLAFIAVQVACSPGDMGEVPQHAVWDVDPAALVSIGVTEGDAPYLFQSVTAARLLPDGRIVVADRGHAAIRVFDRDGGFLTEMGRSGEGPGEFQYIKSMSVSEPDTLDIYDSRAFRFTQYLADGTLVGTLQMKGESGRPEVFLGRFGDGDFALAWIRPRDGPRPLGAVTADVMEIGRFDVSGDLVRRLATATGMWRWERTMYPFSPRFYGFTVGDSVFFTDGLQPELQVVDADGNSLAGIRLHESRVLPDDPWGVLAGVLETEQNQEALNLLSEVPHDSVPATAVVFRDTEGRVWAKEYAPGTDSNWLGLFTRRSGGRWWVLNPDGNVLAEVAIPEGLIPLDAYGERLVGLTRDALGVQRVVVHVMRSMDMD